MKKFLLVALLLTAPLAAMAQFTVFNDNFTNGSTTNQTSVVGGTPSASSTSYDIAASKASTTNCFVKPHQFRMALNATTTSGFWEGAALFTASPVTLATVGDYITLTYTFTNTLNMIGSASGNNSSGLFTGLYNSGGSAPVTGEALANAGLTTTSGSSFASGNCANWQGYVANIGSTNSKCYTRPVQNPATGTTSGNQELIGNAFGGGTYTNPVGVVFGTPEVVNVALTPGSQYTVTYTIALTAAGTLTVTNNLYTGGSAIAANLIFSQTNTAVGTGTNLTQSFDGLCIGGRNATTSANNAIIDISQITVSDSIYGSPGPTFTVTGGGAGCPGSPFAVYLSGSVTTNVYSLYTNGVLDSAIAAQTGTGSALTFGPVSVVGTNTIVAVNPTLGFSAQMSGQAVISILPGPAITTQPSPVYVANNYAGVFTVTSTGGGLGYQWYRNGVALTDTGEFSGSQTASLTINPATSSDIATSANGYYVVITNACGLSVTSTTNTLTLDSPANLIWVGGNPNTNWDLATTANWNNGTAATNFNSGDNVTFDDTSSYPVVKLVGNLEPTSVIESAGQNYVFTGSGGIFGPGSLTMNGGGTLIISNANTYSGGTTINGGDVDIKNSAQEPLGTGPITLNGGKLEIGIASGNATSGLSNINVTANSTLQVDATGTYAFVLLNSLTGSPGATLTINNGAATSGTTSRLRMYGTFTNNAGINITSSGGNEFEITPYNAAGIQVYNGIIAGNGGRFTVRAAGTVIFNNTNSFNDSSVSANGGGPVYGGGPSSGFGYSVLISGGNVGLGANSSPDFAIPNPGTDNGFGASPLGTGYLGINSGPSEGGNASIFANGGAHTVANPIIYTTANTNYVLSITGSNNLTLSGTFNLNGADSTGNTNRIIQVNNTGLTTLSGFITDNGLNCGITKTGTNALYIDGLTNNYTGPTIVSNGTLAGIGVISGPVVVASAGTISGGDSGVIGTLTVSNNLTLGGNVLIHVNKSLSPAQSNDTIYVSSGNVLTNSGTGILTVNNLGSSLVSGDRFVVFNTPLLNGSAISITPAPGTGLAWSNKLAVDGSIRVISSGPVTPTLQTAPTASAIIYGQTLSTSSFSGGIVTNASGATVAGTFTFTSPSIAPGAGTPSESVTFNPTDTVDYNSFNFNVSVTVNKQTPALQTAPTSAAITYGQTLIASSFSGGVVTNITGTTVSGSFAFSTPSTAPNAGTPSESVIFTPGDTADYNSITLNVNVTVNQQTPVLEIAPTASNITNGNALSTSTLNGGVVTNASGATVSGAFTFTAPSTVPSLGTSSQSLTFTPSDSADYNALSLSVSVTVLAAPSVTSIQFTGKPVVSGTSLTISGTNTGAGTIYLLSSTNVASHIDTWTPIWTNTLGGSSSFTTNLPNTVNPAQNQNYYILSTTNN